VLLIIRSRSLNQLVGGGIFLIIITGLFAYLFPDFVDYTFTQTLVSNSSNVSTLASRFNIWQKALDIFGSRSFIGFGPGSFLASVGNNAHNDYLHVFFEYGAFGLVFFLIVEVFKVLDGLKLAAWQKKWEKVDRSLRRSAGTAHLNSSGFDILGLAFFALDVAFLAISLVGNTFNIPVLQWYSYALWGLVVARLRVLQPLESRTTVYKALNK
jgi:O-antigen ligase